MIYSQVKSLIDGQMAGGNEAQPDEEHAQVVDLVDWQALDAGLRHDDSIPASVLR